MHLGKLRGDRNGLYDLLRRHRAHGDDHLAGEYAGRNCVDPGDIHGDIAAHGVVAHLDSRFDHLGFETEGASDEESHKVIAPELLHIRVALLIDPVFGEILGYITIFCHKFSEAAACVENFQHRAGLRITLCEQQEIVSVLLAENDEVRLGISRAQAAGGLCKLALADQMPHLYRCQILIITDHLLLPPFLFHSLLQDLAVLLPLPACLPHQDLRLLYRASFKLHLLSRAQLCEQGDVDVDHGRYFGISACCLSVCHHHDGLSGTGDLDASVYDPVGQNIITVNGFDLRSCQPVSHAITLGSDHIGALVESLNSLLW